MSDLIDRQEIVKQLDKVIKNGVPDSNGLHPISAEVVRGMIIGRPSVESQIIYCKDCTKHNKVRGRYYDGVFVGMMDCCPLTEIRGRAQGHEFDYQFCAYAERRTDG